MERSTTNLSFLDIMMNKTETKIRLNMYNKPGCSERYVPFTSNYPRSCIKNIPFCLVRRICTMLRKKTGNYNGCQS